MRNRRKALLFVAAISVITAAGFMCTDSMSAQKDDHEVKRHSEHHERRRGMNKIKHIVFIVKENRTFDNYFGTFPGADGATSGTISTGEVIPLRHAPDMTPRDIDHSYQAAVEAIDGGAMDRFDL